MDRLIAPNSVPFANADTAPATGTPQYATAGNPVTNTPATIAPAYAWNAMQDEIMNVILGAGLTPNRNSWNQLLTAIQTMLQGSTTNVGVDTGAANAYVVAFTPALPAPVPWVPFWIKIAHANTTASTLNATGTVEPLVGGAHLALQGGEMVANGNALVYWNPTLASGAGSFVLLFCSGAPEQIAPATQPEHAVQLGQLAPSNNTGASSDVTLAPGESVYIDIAAATTAPLHVACADNQSYEIQFQLLGNTGGVALSTLAPNNTSYTNFFTWEQLFNNGTTPTANQGYANGLIFAGSDIRYAKSFVSTKTSSKTMNTWAACAITSSAMATNFIVSTWQAAASSGGAGDTTTAWTSLGTINFPIASTGRIIVRRVA